MTDLTPADQNRSSRSAYWQVGSGALLFLAYYATARFHLVYGAVPGGPTALWLPAGIGLAGLFILKRRGLIPIVLAAAAVHAPFWLGSGLAPAQATLHLAVVVAVAAVQPWLACGMWHRFVPYGIQDLGAALRFVGLAAIAPCTLTTPLLAANLLWSGAWAELPGRVVLAYTSVLTLGSILGILLVIPLYQAWIEEGWPTRRELAQIAVSAAVLVLVQFAAFRVDPTYIYLSVPILLLLALTGGSRAATVVTLLLATATARATVARYGPFTADTGAITYLPLLVYLLVLVVSSLVGRVQYSYVLRQRRELEQAVAVRTAELRREVDARTRAEEQSAYQALLFGHISDAVIATDLMLTIRSWNHAAEEIYGWQADEVIGRSLPEVTRMVGAPGQRGYLLAHLLKTGTWKGEVSQLNRAGRPLVIHAAVALVRDVVGQPTGIVAVNRDITEQRRAQQALESERALLAQRVAERTAELQQANNELQSAAKAKDEFLASMSHELRTPLNTVLTLAELLEMEAAGPLTPQQHKHLQTLRSNGNHLLDLINDILDLSKLQAKKLTVECSPVQVEDVCQASLSIVAPQAERKRIAVSLLLDPAAAVMRADGQRTRQILINLLSNAIKFTPEEGRIGLKVAADAARGRLCFTVWDTGIGIAAADFERLFEPFVQLETGLARHYAGTGLGLPLAVELARLQGGGIEVQSEVGQGSEFTFWLPWQPEPAVAG